MHQELDGEYDCGWRELAHGVDLRRLQCGRHRLHQWEGRTLTSTKTPGETLVKRMTVPQTGFLPPSEDTSHIVSLSNACYDGI
jgi:hypothetical protein